MKDGVTPHEEDRRLGRVGISTAPWIDFPRAEDWTAFLEGWREGYEQWKAEEKRSYEMPRQRDNRSSRRGYQILLSRRRHRASWKETAA